MKCAISVLLVLFSCAPAFADQAAANACADGLSGEAKIVYDAASDGVAGASDPREFVKNKVRLLVVAGKVDSSSARGDAMAAGDCLKKLR